MAAQAWAILRHAMSEGNIELVRAIFRGWNEDGVDGMLPLFHADIEYRPMEERGAVHGHDAMRRYFERWMEPWDELQVEPTEMRSEGDRVLNGCEVRGTGSGSGVEITMHYWQVWLIHAGRAVRWEEYLDRDEAVAAFEGSG
ncbi:MAG TPA: nuclear transport factor 2 family protein [Thermoleophilaceae bacterium]|nr:nuclear transport factor 2 family protein [Thermoleophilaceae bacterium]